MGLNVVMTCNLTVLLKERMDTFSKGHKKIAKFILEHCDKVAYITAGRLAQEVGVSESTILRFAMSLGYDGYGEFQRDLIKAAHSHMTVIQRMEMTKRMVGDCNVTEYVVHSDMDRLKAMLDRVDPVELDKVIACLLSAKSIYIIGLRSSATLAEFLGFYFNLLFNSVKVVNSVSGNDIFEQVLHVEPGDVIIGISFPRYSRRTVKAMKYAQSCGAKAIAITDNELSPLCPYSQYALYADSDMSSFVDSLVAPMSLINALIVNVAMKKEQDITDLLTTLEDLWDENEVFDGRN